MKLRIFKYLFILGLFSSNAINAQRHIPSVKAEDTLCKQRLEASFGVAVGDVEDLIYYFLSNSELGDNPPEIKYVSPVYAGTLDYTPKGYNFSIGLAFSYQYLTDIPYTYTGTSLEKITRINIAFRFLHNIGSCGSNSRFYYGFRIGASIWNDMVPPGYPTELGYLEGAPSINRVSFQFVLGARVYGTEHFGLHFELCIGSPYIAEAGITIK